MIRRILFILAVLLSSTSWGQFTYFNQITGWPVDTLADAYYNVEIIEDTIYTFGVIIDLENGFRYKLGKFDMTGAQILDKEYLITYPIFFASSKASFVKSQDENFFYMSVGIVDTIYSGLIGKFDLNLDTLWTKRYDNFAPYTYMRRNLDVGDGIVIVGEIEADGTQRGTMLTKIDYEGEIIWDEVLRHGNGHYYRNGSIVEHQGYLMVGGYRDLSGDSPKKGYLTKCSLIDGDREWEQIDLDAGFGMGIGYELCKTTNGKLLAAATVQYEDGPSSTLWDTKIRILEIDIENESIVSESDYFSDGEMTNAWMIKIIATSDGGALVLGRETSEQFSEFSTYLFKLDSLGNEEWFADYAYIFGDNRLSLPRDVEQTSDGGYVIVGEYINLDVTSGQRAWMFKVDACGDEQWLTCELADGLWDISASLDDPLRVYPNPAQDYVYLESANLVFGEVIEIFDPIGRVVLRTAYNLDQPLDVSSLNNGLYSIVVLSGSTRFTGSLSIQK